MKKIYFFILVIMLSASFAMAYPAFDAIPTAIKYIKTDGTSTTNATIPFKYGADFEAQDTLRPSITFNEENSTGIGSYPGTKSIVFWHDFGIAFELVYHTVYGVIFDIMDITFFQEDVYFEASTYHNQLTGTGNAFACFDEHGMLYRSETQCVS